MKASAIAHPIQGLIKYHGLRDRTLRIPFHGSISVCTGPIFSHTTVEPLTGGGDGVVIDGQTVEGRALERARTVLDAVRARAGDNDFVIHGPEVHGIPNLVNLFGIESPGLTSSMAIAEYVATLVGH